MTKIIPYSDPAKNAFAKTNPYYTDNRFLNTQDPTVLGFKLLFNFDQADSGLLWGAATNSAPPENTALGFLTKIGDGQRAYYLKQFLRILHGVNNQTPWYFQNLTGLAEAWKHDLSIPLIKEDSKLEIECLESIDLRMTALIDLYRKACFDWKYRREVVPKNLRQFSMSVYVYEQRWIGNPGAIAFGDFREAFGNDGIKAGLKNMAGVFESKAAAFGQDLLGMNEILNDAPNSNVNIVEGVPMSTTRNLFHFDFCEFDPSESGGHLSSLSHADPGDGIKQKLVIKYQAVEEENMYAWWDDNPVADSWIPALDEAALDALDGGVTGQVRYNIAQAITNPAAFLENLAEQGLKKAESFANSKITALALGNIYGISLSTLGGPGGLAAVGSAIKSAGSSILNSNGHMAKAGSNVYERSTSPSLANYGGEDINQNFGVGSPSLTNDTGENISQNIYAESPTPATGNITDGSQKTGPSLTNTDPAKSPSGNIFE